jgi:Mor family transcriptional regulator
MNKDVIKKYKKEFDTWLDGESVLAKHVDSKIWTESTDNAKWNSWNMTYIINDEYVEYRRALAEGKTVEYKMNTCYGGWNIVDNTVQHFSSSFDYRIKPDEPEFKIEKKWSQEVNGLTYYLYKGQKDRCIKRNHPMPSYSREELHKWVVSQPNFNSLYDNWVKSGFDTWTRPSINRLDNTLSYSFDNIELITWKENMDKAKEDIKDGSLNTSKAHKAVHQLSRDGEFIEKYISVGQASRATGINKSHIASTCRGNRKSAGGFKWKYIGQTPEQLGLEK